MYSIANSTNRKKITLTIFLILSFVIPSVILIIAYAMNKIWLGSDKTVLISDLRSLNFPLSASLRHVLSGDASIFYQTYSLLGSGNISTYMSSYSGLFSWFMGMFPYKMLPDVLYVIEVVETGLCGLTCFLYFRFGHIRPLFLNDNYELRANDRFLKILPDIFALVFSTLYATCSYNMVYFVNMPWMNITISLPIVLLGIDKIIESRFKKDTRGVKEFLFADIKIDLILILSFAYSLYSCYYITFATGIFGLIYFALRMVDVFKKEDFFKKLFGSVYECGVSVILGTGLVMPLLLPTLLSLNKSEVYLAGNASLNNGLILRNPLKLFSMLIPGADAVISDGNGLPFIYCGVITLILFLVFLFLPRVRVSQKIATVMVFAFFIMSLSLFPLYEMWHGGRVPNWHPGRFTYTFAMFLVMVAFRTGCLICEGFVKTQNGKSSRKDGLGRILISVMALYALAETTINASNVFMRLNINYGYEWKNIYESIVEDIGPISDYVIENDPYSRMVNTHTYTQNDPAIFGYNGFEYFNSTFNQYGAGAFYKLGTKTHYNFALDYGFTPALMKLMGYKYIVYNKDNEELIESAYNVESVFDHNGLGLGKLNDALPLGFVVSENCLDSDGKMESNEIDNQNLILSDLCGTGIQAFKEINTTMTENTSDDSEESDGVYFTNLDFVTESENGIWFFMEDYELDSIPEEDKKEVRIFVENTGEELVFEAGVSQYAVFLGKFDPKENVKVEISGYYPLGKMHIYEFDSNELNKAMNILGEDTLNVEYYKKGTLKGDIDVKKDGLLFFSIPYENGYKLYIDGEKSDITLYRGVFLCTNITKGYHSIELAFCVPGFFPGVFMCTITICIITFLTVVRLQNKLMKNKTIGAF